MKRKAILEFLKETARTGEEIAAFFVGGSLARMPGIASGLKAVTDLRKSRWRVQPDIERDRVERIRIQRVIQALKVDGLIMSTKSGKSATYQLTKDGKIWLDEKKEKGLPGNLALRKFKSEPAEAITIIAYDIPNKQRQYRDWLRQQLIELGFTLLQRSIFVGKVTVPEELIADLAEYHILDYVEIFEITKKGTLRLSKR